MNQTACYLLIRNTKLKIMINEEEELTTGGDEQNDNDQANSSSSETGEGHKQDPVHNTGDEHMMIDEEGAEIKPDDQV